MHDSWSKVQINNTFNEDSQKQKHSEEEDNKYVK